MKQIKCDPFLTKRVKFIMLVSPQIQWRKSDLLENDKLIPLWYLYFNRSLKISRNSLVNTINTALLKTKFLKSSTFEGVD